MDFWDAKSVDFSWKGKTGALHKPRAYGIMSLHSDCRALSDGRADARQMPRVLSDCRAAGEGRA